jgi:CII-binding regulator of phage lambda lysogenization HflD
VQDKDRLLRIEEKLDKITDKLHETNTILAENTQSLILHEKRTDLAEKKIEIVQLRLEKQLEKEGGILKEIEEKLSPIKEHVTIVSIVFKYIIPTIAASTLFLIKLGIVKL